MRRAFFSIVLLFIGTSLFADAAPPEITAISPVAGPTSGGTRVTITGANLSLPPNFACILPCPTKVRFGSAEVTAGDETNEQVAVTTPAHAAGTVDVTLTTGDGRSVTVPGGFTFVATEPDATAYLLPIYTDGDVAGAHGSLWATELWIRNNGGVTALLAPWDCPAGQACPAVFPLKRPLQPNETLRNLPAFFRPPTSNPGRLLYVSDTVAANVSMSLRLWDRSRQTFDAGTEIPVIGPSELTTTTAYLMSVPLDPNFRVMLRVYDRANTEARFRVRIYGQMEGIADPAPMRDFEIAATTADQGPYRLQPAYAQSSEIDALSASPGITSKVRVEVEPLTKGSMFWAFIAITNNETQRVTLVTPQ